MFSPQPYAGEEGEPCLLTMYLDREEQGTAAAWEWLRLNHEDNRQAQGEFGPLPEDLPRDRALVFHCYDFENSREGVCLAGITTKGEVIWGKYWAKEF